MDDRKAKFCENYRCKIVNDTKRCVRYNPPVFFTDPTRADIVVNDYHAVETEKLLTIEIPESRFNSLVEMESRFFNFHRHSKTEVDMFEMLLRKEREESYYRQTNEAVRKAYEQYSLMLNLAGHQRSI